MRTAPPCPGRRGRRLTHVVVVGCLMAPGVLAHPAAASTDGGPQARNSATAGSASAGGAAGGSAASGVRVSGDTAAAAPDIRQPDVRNVHLNGIDQGVLDAAPAPGAHGVGQSELGEPPPEPEPRALRVAVAAEVSAGQSPAALVAVSADAAFPMGTSIQVRVKESGGWSAWEALSAADGHGPDPRSPEARGIRAGSEPLMTVGATDVQVRIDTATGRVPAGTQLNVISAPSAASDATVGPANTSEKASGAPVSVAGLTAEGGSGLTAEGGPGLTAKGTVAARATIPRPVIFTRAQWGADESWRSRGPYYTGDIRAGFLHHTASTSNYSPEQTPAQIRAIYAYHTRSLGHSDIDYNFVADRFGRLWEGRYGGMDRPVLGGHTAGFNEHTFAVVALGNFQSTAPDPVNLARLKDSVARLFAWKLGLYGVNPVSTAHLLSAGYIKPTRYPKGTVAAIPAISSHQMVNYTSCPGIYLQRELPGIRALAAKYAHLVITPPTPSTSSVQYQAGSAVTLTARADRAVSWRADIFSPCSATPVRSYTGTTPRAGPIGIRWDLRDTFGRALLPAAYGVRVTGTAADRSAVLPVVASVVITPAPGGAWGPCGNVARVLGAEAAATSVLWGRLSAPSSRTVVLTASAMQSLVALSAGVAAGPLARHLKAPLLLTARSQLSAPVAADLRTRRATSAIVVGDESVVSTAVVRAVQKLRINVTRISGSTAAATAAAVAAKFPAGAPVVLVSAGSAPAHALSGAALAGTRNNPVLLAGESSLPPSTRTALAGRRSVTVAAPGTLTSATVAAALPRGAAVTRLAGVDEVAASTAISAAASRAVQRVVVMPATRASWGTAPLAAAFGAPLLFTGSATLPASVGSYLDQRSGLRAGLTPVSRAWLTDGVLGATSRLLSGQAWAPRIPASYKLTRANATPEPVKRGRTITVRAKVKVTQAVGDGWRKAPRGTVVALQFRAIGAKAYRTVATGRLTTLGKAQLKATANRTGRWRLVVGRASSKSDLVKVRS